MDKKRQDIAYFLSFCIEQYKNVKGMDGAEVMETFAKYGVLDYLNNHFEILHQKAVRLVPKVMLRVGKDCFDV